MEFKVGEGKAASPKREFKLLRARNQRNSKSNLLEAIAQVNGASVVSRVDEDGVMRMKIVVKKQDLKQMLEVMKGGGKNSISTQPSFSPLPSMSLEQRLILMRKRHLPRVNQAKGSRSGPSSWRPVLQSIPEELLS